MIVNKKREIRMDQRRSIVASMLLRHPGVTQREICDKLEEQRFTNPDSGKPYSLGTINADVQALQKEWRDEAQAEIAAWKALQIEQINEVIRQAWKDKDLNSVLKSIKMQSDIIGTQQPIEQDEADEDQLLQLPASAIASSFYDVYRDIHAHGHTEYVFKGGRGSTKSSFASLVLIELLVNNPEWHALATRQVANTLRDSVYSQLVWAINYLGYAEKFKCTTSPLEIQYIPTGQTIYFRGCDDPLKIKSIKPKFGYINMLWFEELDQFHGEKSVRSIEQSAIRGGDQAYLFKSFNPPPQVSSWVNKWLKVPDDARYVHESDYRTVPKEWLGQTFIDMAEHLSKVNPKAYQHEYLGLATELGGLVFPNVVIRKITDEEIWGSDDGQGHKIGGFDHILHGLDWGYFPDPNSYGKMHYDAARMKLYIFGEYRSQKQSNREIYDGIVAAGYDPRQLLIYDSAEPKSGADLRAYGAYAKGAEKGPESVRYSIKWLQSLVEIVIDDTRAPFHAQEFLNYELEQDRDGNYISEFPDKNNHAIDDVRYATNLYWRRAGA